MKYVLHLYFAGDLNVSSLRQHQFAESSSSNLKFTNPFCTTTNPRAHVQIDLHDASAHY